MAVFDESVTLDGITDFDLLGVAFGWSGATGGYLPAIDVFDDTDDPDAPGDLDTVDLILTGEWFTNAISVGSGDGVALSVADRLLDDDVDAGGTPTIRTLYAFTGPNDIELDLTAIDTIRLGNFDDTVAISGTALPETVSLGGGTNTFTWSPTADDPFIASIISYAGDNTITLEGGFVRSIGLSGGVDVLDVSGGVGQALLGGANDTATLNDGARVGRLQTGPGDDSVALLGDAGVEALTMNAGDDTLRMEGGAADIVSLGSGDNTANIVGGSIVAMAGFGGDDTVTVGDAQIEQLRLGRGDNSLTVGAGRVDGVLAGDGADTVVIREGRIDMLSLGDGNNSAATGEQFIQAILAFDGNDVVSIGSGGAGMVKLSGGTNVLNARDGFVEAYRGFGGADVVRTGDVGAGSIDLGTGTNRVEGGTGFIQSIVAQFGRDAVTLGGDAGAVSLGGGPNALDAREGHVERYTGFGGVDTVRTGERGAESIDLGRGDNVFEGGTGFVRSVTAYGGDDSVTLRGDAGAVSLHGGANTLDAIAGRVESYRGGSGIDTVRLGERGADLVELMGGDNVLEGGTGYIGTVHAHGGADTVTLQGGAGLIDVGGGDDAVTTGSDVVLAVRTGAGNDTVTQGTGGVGLIATQDGDDVVRLGPNLARHVRLGAGDDRVVMGPGDTPARGTQIVGEGGFDTVDLSAFAADLHVYMATTAYQNIAAADGDLSQPGTGYVSFVSIEAIVLGSGDDRITARAGDTRLTGGDGADTFVFTGEGGTDTITDFAVGTDRIHVYIGGVEDRGDLSFAQDGDDVTVVGAGLSLRLEGTRVAQIDAEGVFDFAPVRIARGGPGDDRLSARDGDTRLTGGDGADTFVFVGEGGTDTITDFAVGTDLIEIDIDGIDSRDDLTIAQDGADVTVSGADLSLRIEGVTVAQIDAEGVFDFGLAV